MRAIYIVLLALGSAVMLYALFMATTVQSSYGRVHNIGLQSDRQLFLIFGCFLVLVGVILFAVHQLKERPSQDASEIEARQAAAESVKKGASQTPATIQGSPQINNASHKDSIHAPLVDRGCCEKCGAKIFINYGDAYHTICKNCA